jgi:hypothetical protein
MKTVQMNTSHINERRSIPILVPDKNVSPSSPKSVECSIKKDLFDPNINSPPSDWMCKLQIRINGYYNNNELCNSEKK